MLASLSAPLRACNPHCAAERAPRPFALVRIDARASPTAFRVRAPLSHVHSASHTIPIFTRRGPALHALGAMARLWGAPFDNPPALPHGRGARLALSTARASRLRRALTARAHGRQRNAFERRAVGPPHMAHWRGPRAAISTARTARFRAALRAKQAARAHTAQRSAFARLPCGAPQPTQRRFAVWRSMMASMARAHGARRRVASPHAPLQRRNDMLGYPHAQATHSAPHSAPNCSANRAHGGGGLKPRAPRAVQARRARRQTAKPGLAKARGGLKVREWYGARGPQHVEYQGVFTCVLSEFPESPNPGSASRVALCAMRAGRPRTQGVSRNSRNCSRPGARVSSPAPGAVPVIPESAPGASRNSR